GQQAYGPVEQRLSRRDRRPLVSSHRLQPAVRPLLHEPGVLTVAVPPVTAPELTSKVSANDARPARAAVNPLVPFGWSGNVISTTSEATRRLSISSRLLVTYRPPVETPVPDTL